MGMPVGSPTQIAREFNQHFSGQPVSAQTVRKWLHAETVPTQPKLLALSAWLGVSAQWLRYGSVERQEQATPVQSSVVVFGKEYAELAPFLDKLLKLSPRDIRIVKGIVQLMQTENGGR